MQKLIRYLVVLLAAQLLLAVAMSYTGPRLVTRPPDTPLFALTGHSVDHITIAGPDHKQLVLAHEGAGWVLPGTGDFPADGTRVDDFLQRLEGLKHGLAVATSAAAQSRFKVGDHDFERRVQLAQGKTTVATLYFGTSPGLRQVHARSQDDKAVYTTNFATYEAPLKAADWEDKHVLVLPASKIAAMTVAGLTLQRVPDAITAPAATPGKATSAATPAATPGKATSAATPAATPGKATTGTPAPATATTAPPAAPATPGTHWSAAGLAAGQIVNQSGANTLADRLAGLQIGSVLGRDAKPGYGLDQPVLDVRLTQQGGNKIEYRIGKQGNDFVLKASSRPEYFRLLPTTADGLIKAAHHDQLVQATPAPAATPPAATSTHPPATAPAAAPAATRKENTP
jgi:hypothetical protein